MLTRALKDHINSWFTHRPHIPFLILKVPKQEPHQKSHISLRHRLSHCILFTSIYSASPLYCVPNQTGLKKKFSNKTRIAQSRSTNNTADTSSAITRTWREKPINLSMLWNWTLQELDQFWGDKSSLVDNIKMCKGSITKGSSANEKEP